MNTMTKEKIEYIQKYLNIDTKNLLEGADLINDVIFNKDSQQNLGKKHNLLIFLKEIHLLRRTKSLVTEAPIYNLLNSTPVNNYEYPENKKFAVCLTHDVDIIYPSFLNSLLSSTYYLKNLEFDKIKNFFWKGKSPYCNFDEIIKLEKRYDAKSSFYFMASEDIRRSRYDIENMGNILTSIMDEGWEVGLHGGYNAYNSLEIILKEKKTIENILCKKVIGYRNHFLMFKIPETWKLLVKAGFKYDTTFGYNDKIGFRNGICRPFYPFDTGDNQEIDIIEIPLNIMDVALYGYDTINVWNNVKKMIEDVEKFSGVLTILWHNDVFNCPHKKDWSRLYNKILKYCRDKNAWITNGKEISEIFEHK